MTIDESTIDALTEAAAHWRERLHLPGVIFGIAQAGERLTVRSVGYADRERERPFTPETRLRVGSNTKSMTAALAAALIDEGLITWETPASDLYAGFQTKAEEPAVLRDIFSMRLGLASGETILYGEGLTPAQLFEIVAELPVEAAPRARMIYNNELFAAGGLLTAMAAGYSLEESLNGYRHLLETRILEAWGLKMSGVGRDINRFGGDFALPYEPDARTWEMHPVGVPSIGALAPAGAVFASTQDILTYLLAHLQHYKADTAPLNACYQGDYGLGWAIEPGVYWHNGGIDGFLSHMAFFPEVDAAFFVAANAGTADYFVHGMRAAFQVAVLGEGSPGEVLGQYGAADLARRAVITRKLAATPTQEQSEAVVGTYEKGVNVEQREDDGALLLHLGPRALRLHPIDGQTAFITTGMSDILHIKVAGQRMHIREFGADGPLPQHGGLRKLS